MKKAFTLAEVLVTLGIIGIVAALTMPALVADYQKKVTATKLKRFYALLNQAAQISSGEAVNPNKIERTIDCSALTSANNPDTALNFFNTAYKPYLNTVMVEKTGKGVKAALSDGTGVYIRKDTFDGTSDYCGHTYIIFCTDYKRCGTIDETKGASSSSNGKETFVFMIDGRTTDGNWNGTRESALASCTTTKYRCSTLIMADGWEIRDDYPW
jgi:prepilin-type N-terminal cleavage/methylation domain-containing protein